MLRRLAMFLQEIMGRAEASSGDSLVHMDQDECVLILLKHCRDMRQQETRLRLLTLLLQLSCVGLLIVITVANLRHHGSPASSGQESAVQSSPAFSKQQAMCASDQAANPPTFQTLHIYLTSVATDDKSEEQYVKWKVKFGEKYDEENRAIVIPEKGFYFVYLRFTLRCPGDGNFKVFSVQLHTLRKGYNEPIPTDVSNGVVCTSEGPTNYFVGELFEFSDGDHVSVKVLRGYELISKLSLGAYVT